MARAVDPEVRTVIARNLRRAVANQDKGVVSLASDLEMSQPQFSGYLRTHRGFSIETLLRLAVVLECSLDDLVANVNPQYTRGAAIRRRRDLEPEIAVAVDVLRALLPGELEAVIGMARAFASHEGPSRRIPERSAETIQEARTTDGRRQHRRK